MSRFHHCTGVVHRVNTRSFSVSGTIRYLYGYRRYDCEGCGWRGWLRAGDPPVQFVVWRRRLQATLGAAVTIAVTTTVTILLSSLVQ